MSKRAPALLPIFRSEHQLRLLEYLYVRAGKAFSIADLSRHTGIPQQTISREVKRLLEFGLLTSRTVERQKLVSANENSSYFSDLRDLLVKAIIREAKGF